MGTKGKSKQVEKERTPSKLRFNKPKVLELKIMNEHTAKRNERHKGFN